MSLAGPRPRSPAWRSLPISATSAVDRSGRPRSAMVSRTIQAGRGRSRVPRHDGYAAPSCNGFDLKPSVKAPRIPCTSVIVDVVGSYPLIPGDHDPGKRPRNFVFSGRMPSGVSASFVIQTTFVFCFGVLSRIEDEVKHLLGGNLPFRDRRALTLDHVHTLVTSKCRRSAATSGDLGSRHEGYPSTADQPSGRLADRGRP